MFKVVYSDGCLRVQDNNGNFVMREVDLVIKSEVDMPKDTALVTVSFIADISELKS